MEGAGSRDVSNYYLGGVMPSSLNRQEETYSSEVAADPHSLLGSSARQTNLSAVANQLDANLGQRNLNPSAEEQVSMMKSIQEIFELVEEQPNEDDEMVHVDEEEEPVVDFEDRQRRTERLKGVLSTLAQLWWTDSEHMDVVAEKLADGSRDREWGFQMALFSTHPQAFKYLVSAHILFFLSAL